jgi:hypothetical protein
MTEKEIEVLELIKKVNADLEDKEDMKVWNELMALQPFAFYQERIDDLERQVNQLRGIVDALRKHKHSEDGEACVPL